MTLCFAKGFRTITAAVGIIIAGLLGAVGTIDLTPVVALFVKNPAYLGAAMAGVGVLLGLFRYLTTTPLFQPVAPPPAAATADPVMIKRGLDSGE